jgi:O-antigen/teichoic acid export membrane protein
VEDGGQDSAATVFSPGESPERGALARRSALNFSGLAAANALQFILVLMLARGLGQHDAGIFFESFAAVRLLAVLAAFGLDVTAIRQVSVARARGEATGHVIRLAVVIAGSVSVAATVAVFAAAPLAADAFGSGQLETVLRVMVVSLPAVVIQSVLIGATRGTGNMRPFVLVDQIADGVLRVVAIGGVLALGGGLTATAYAYTASALLTTVAAAISAAKLWGDQRPGMVRPWELIRFTSYQWGASVAGVGLLWADTLLLGLWRPPAEVAVYSIATRTVLAGMVFILPIGFAFQPVIGRMFTVGDRDGLRSMYSFATKWATIVGCPPLIFLALFATPIITLLYQDSYTRGAWPLALLALGQTVNAATGPCGHVVTMVGRSDLVFRNSLFALVLNLALNLVLIPPYGMIGAGAAWGVSIAAWNVVRVLQVRRVLEMQPFDAWVSRVTVSLGAFILAAVVLRLELPTSSNIALCFLGALGSGAVYIAALRVTRAVDDRDRVLPGPVLRLLRIRS